MSAYDNCSGIGIAVGDVIVRVTDEEERLINSTKKSTTSMLKCNLLHAKLCAALRIVNDKITKIKEMTDDIETALN